MAQYTVTHRCGHQATHQIYGPGRHREWRLKKLAEELCPECEEAERQRRNAEAAAKNREMGLPPLTGTEKQVAWAESIRAHIMKELDDELAAGLAAGEQITEEGQMLIDTLMAQTEARWWIDARHFSIRSLMELLAEQIRCGVIKPVRPEDETKAALEAKAEATIRPEQPKTETVAEIRITPDGKIEVEFPEMNEAFRKLIRFELGYTWTGSVWRRIAGLFGTAQDRAVETGHRLLAAGFPVRIYDQQLRQRILDGDFEPEPKRVIRKLSTGEHAGWFGISWPRSEDYYRAASRLPGAKWDKPYVVVPPEQFEAVVGFAETYAFALSPGAKELVEAARAAKEAELVAPPMEPKKPAKGRKPSRVPEPLEVPDEVTIDDDLRDD